MKKENMEIILIGGGGHCKSCVDVMEQEGRFQIAGILEREEKNGTCILGYPVIGRDEDIKSMADRYKNMFITLGYMKTPDRRVALYEMAKRAGARFPVIVSPGAFVSRHASLAEGTIVMENAVIHAGARIGRNSIINTSAVIEHDACVGDHCHISTGCMVNGGCQIGQRVFLGSGSVLIHSVSVCDCAVIGAGAVVTKDIQEPGTYVGVPAKALCEGICR